MADGPGGVGDEIARLREEDAPKKTREIGKALDRSPAGRVSVSAGGGKSLGESARSSAGLGSGAVLSSMITMMPSLMAQSFQLGQQMKMLQEMKNATPVTNGSGGQGPEAPATPAGTKATGGATAKPTPATTSRSAGSYLESLIGGQDNPLADLERWLFGGPASGSISGPAGARGGAGAPAVPAEDIITRVAKGMNLDMAAKDPGKFIAHIISQIGGLGG
jgi:hypothetical protein